jgi:hypothetical protein
MGQIALYGGRPAELDAGLVPRTTSEMPPQGAAALEQSRQREEQMRRQPPDSAVR